MQIFTLSAVAGIANEGDSMNIDSVPTSSACGGTRSALVRTMTRGRGLAHPAMKHTTTLLVFSPVSSVSPNHAALYPAKIYC